jgi:hypothetical protein
MTWYRRFSPVGPIRNILQAPDLHNVGLNLAKLKNSPRWTLSDDSEGAGTRPKSLLFPFDHAHCPNGTACSLGYSPPVRSKLRGKLFLRTLLLPGASFCEFWPVRQPDCLPILVPERYSFAGKPPFAKLRPTSEPHHGLVQSYQKSVSSCFKRLYICFRTFPV